MFEFNKNIKNANFWQRKKRVELKTNKNLKQSIFTISKEQLYKSINKKPNQKLIKVFAPNKEQIQNGVQEKGVNNQNLIGKNYTFWNYVKITLNPKETIFKGWSFFTFLITNITGYLIGVIAFGVSLSLFYFTFLNDYFIIKTYQLNFSSGSYLNQKQVSSLIKIIENQKQLGILPQNQYWYINSPALTISAREYLPTIQNIIIKNKIWPDKINLEITTDSALLTLGIFENGNLSYWRIGKNGKVLNQDTSSLKENLVIVQTPLSISKSESTSTTYTSFESYNFENNQSQLNRFYFSVWLKNFLSNLGFENFTLAFPSLNDQDVVAKLANGSKLFFNSVFFDQDVQKRRLQSVLSTNLDGQNTVQSRLDQGQINYIDLRIPKRVFVCQINNQC